jgi:hypothetical protein
MMSDSALLPVMDKCADFCWFHGNPHAIDTPEWHEYKERILAGRPTTFALLDAIWLRYQDHLEQQNRSTLLHQLEEPADPAPPSPREVRQSLEDADDESIQKLYWATAKHVARGR